MKNNILASIALFGIYRRKNLDTYVRKHPNKYDCQFA